MYACEPTPHGLGKSRCARATAVLLLVDGEPNKLKPDSVEFAPHVGRQRPKRVCFEVVLCYGRAARMLGGSNIGEMCAACSLTEASTRDNLR